MAYAFKFAKYAQINQGCIPSIFCVTSIYIAVLFYFKFDEKISNSKIVSIVMIIPCILLLSLDKKKVTVTSSDQELEEHELRIYGLISIVFALCAPFFWTFKSFYIRKAIETKVFPVYDLALDTQGYSYSVSCLVYVVFLTQHPFNWDEFIQGQITGFFFVLGALLSTNAFSTGPGGPINVLICTQVVYQTALNALFLNQNISLFQGGGIVCGFMATLIMIFGDSIAAKLCGTNSQDTTEQKTG